MFRFGVGWVTGVPLGLQNPEGGACRLRWVRFPHSPAKFDFYQFFHFNPPLGLTRFFTQTMADLF